MPLSRETEIRLLQTEIADRQRRLQYLVLGDPTQSVFGCASVGLLSYGADHKATNDRMRLAVDALPPSGKAG